jgi:hypothetical protein
VNRTLGVLALSAAADLCLQVSGDQGPTERGKGLGNSFLGCEKKKTRQKISGLQSYSGSTEGRIPYSAGIARPNSNAGVFGYRSEDCVVQLHKGHSGRSTESHVADVVAPRHRGQRLALRNPRQRLIPLMLGELRLPSKPTLLAAARTRPLRFGSGSDGVRTRPFRVFFSR